MYHIYKNKYRYIDTQTDREPDRQTDEKVGRQAQTHWHICRQTQATDTGRQAGRLTGRQTDRQAD